MEGQSVSTRFPYEIKELHPEEKAELARLYASEPDFISVGPKKYILLRPYCDDAANIYNMPVRPSDIFVVTYQRSGTTWTQELVWLLANDLDYETAAKIPLTERFRFLELFTFFNKNWQKNLLDRSQDKAKAQALIEKIATPVTERLLSAPSPRFIKTHLPMSLLPPNLLDTAKVVYVARDPRDVAVSCYHHSKLFRVLDFPSPFKDFWNLFIRGLFTMLPFFDTVKEAWELRHHPNMLFLFYEELIQDLPAVIRRVADFLGKEVTAEQLAHLCDHLSFDNFKQNDSVNFEELREYGVLSPDEKFIRKGKAGGWHEYFDDEMTQQAEKWIQDNLRDTDLRFPSM
uniref:Sulfotransferase domain-containing protein n=1 Tax=Heliothis virescens TaxID=7102 RepID=A0A2A4KBH0_HELVI